ncbi:MAG: ribosome-associated translation inhibitor RaiA [Chitinophagales bacterium]|nr:ribosome-associated translation inhibitor RaiA [Chitinophagales bacterium]
MNLHIHAVNFKASDQLEEVIDEKVKKLVKHFDKIIDVDVYLKLENHQQIKDKIVELKVHVPGDVLFASEIAKTFEEALSEVVVAMKKQLGKHKEKYAK